MPVPDYWAGMVMCPRKGLSHITHNKCIGMYELTACGTCPKKDEILLLRKQEQEEEKQRKKERKLLSPRKRDKK